MKTITRFQIKPVATMCLSALIALAVGLAHADTGAPAQAMEAGMDKSVLPGDDFFRYVNGGWDKATVIPDDKSSVGVVSALRDESDAIVRELIEKATKAVSGDPARKVGDYYSAYLNTDQINQLGLTQIQPQLHSIAAIKTRSALSAYLGAHLRTDVDPLNNTSFFTENLFGLWVAQQFHDHTQYTSYLLQGGLGLPDREYYLSDSPKMVQIRTAYLEHIAAMLKLAGLPNPDQAARRIVALELKIAKGHTSRADSEDMDKADNTWKKADFKKMAPGMDWNAYFAAAGLAQQSSFIVWHPGAVKTNAALVASTSLETWKDYLRFHALNQHASVLPQAFFDQKFKFSSVMSGAKAPLPRWKYAVNATNAALGEEVGKMRSESVV